jgi:hypothetical protein
MSDCPYLSSITGRDYDLHYLKSDRIILKNYNLYPVFKLLDILLHVYYHHDWK